MCARFLYGREVVIGGLKKGGYSLLALAGLGPALAQDQTYYFDHLDRAADFCREILVNQNLESILDFPNIQTSRRSYSDGQTWISFEEENNQFGLSVLEIELPSNQVVLTACSASAQVFPPGSRNNTWPSDMANIGSKMVNDAIASWLESYLDRRAKSGQIIKVKIENKPAFEWLNGNVGAQCFEDDRLIVTHTTGQNIGYLTNARIQILSASDLHSRNITELDSVLATCNMSGGMN